MKGRWGRVVAPVVVTLLMLLLYGGYLGFVAAQLSGVWRYGLGAVLLALSALMIGVCVERIKEIKRGEEDDLGQY